MFFLFLLGIHTLQEEEMNAIVVGSANTDLIIHVDALPALGDTEVGYGFKNGPGGKGANQAVALSRLGAKTAFVARFGKDEFSSLLIDTIQQYGVKLEHAVIDEKRRGGVVFILVDRAGNNTMIADLGSNLHLDSMDIEKAREAFTGSELLLMQFEVSESANQKACEIAVEKGLRIVLNPAPMKKFDTSILRFVDVLTPNMFELSRILRLIHGRDVLSDHEKDVEKIVAAARSIVNFGVGHVVVTAGKRGCIHVDEKDFRCFGTYKVKQVDSTAAGDAFTAAFGLKFAEGSEIGESVRFASASAALTVSREGALPSLPYGEEVDTFLKENTLTKFE
jgi:ribokinase